MRNAGSPLIDGRDGKIYRTVNIGGSVWTAENLCWEGAGRAFEGRREFQEKYGRLYTWHEAMACAPEGWHLPSDGEWGALASLGGCQPGKALKASEEWQEGGSGTDDFGFAALPGGYCFSGLSLYVWYNGAWWSSTEKSSLLASSRGMSYLHGGLVCGVDKKAFQFSVRLVKD